MDRFHVIDGAAVILASKGVYRQAKVYRRGDALFAAHGTGFIRLYRDGTSLPDTRCEAFEIPGAVVKEDGFGRLELVLK